MTDGPPFNTVKVASRVPGRRPEWKTHPTVGRARSSLAQYREGDYSSTHRGRYGAGEVWEATPTGSWIRVHPAP